MIRAGSIAPLFLGTIPSPLVFGGGLRRPFLCPGRAGQHDAFDDKASQRAGGLLPDFRPWGGHQTERLVQVVVLDQF